MYYENNKTKSRKFARNNLLILNQFPCLFSMFSLCRCRFHQDNIEQPGNEEHMELRHTCRVALFTKHFRMFTL
jgi:hypothetical protein